MKKVEEDGTTTIVKKVEEVDTDPSILEEVDTTVSVVKTKSRKKGNKKKDEKGNKKKDEKEIRKKMKRK